MPFGMGYRPGMNETAGQTVRNSGVLSGIGDFLRRNPIQVQTPQFGFNVGGSSQALRNYLLDVAEREMRPGVPKRTRFLQESRVTPNATTPSVDEDDIMGGLDFGLFDFLVGAGQRMRETQADAVSPSALLDALRGGLFKGAF